MKYRWHLPSTLPSASTKYVCTAGIAHATRWNKWERASIASCPHFKPAARNHATVRQTHHAKAAMQQKYSDMKSIVQGADCR